MSVDKQEIKALADRVKTDRRFCADENHHVLADGVLVLIAEIKRLEEHKQGLIDLREAHGFDCWAAALVKIDQLKAENDGLRKDAERYRFVRNPIGTSSPLAIWNERKMPLFSAMADAVVDEFMAKEASHD